jgi:hypothetical protein
MRSRATLIIVTLVLAICLVCPLVEMFDQWDHALQTGNDTESPVMVLALCVGVAYLFARITCKFSRLGPLAEALSFSCAHEPFSTLMGSSSVIPIPVSPPALALRV